VISFFGSNENWHEIAEFYNGNPLALELAAKHIDEVFFGDISEFLRNKGQIFSDLKDLLDGHFNRMSDSEKEIMYWLSVHREPMSYSDLKEDILSPLSKKRTSVSIAVPATKITG